MNSWGYRPFRVGARVAVSFSLLGVLEERSFLSLLSPRWPVEVVGLGVIFFFIVVDAPCPRVYPPITISGRLLRNYRDNIKLHTELQKERRRKLGLIVSPGSFHSEYFCSTWMTSAPYFSSLSSVTPSICSSSSGSLESFSVYVWKISKGNKIPTLTAERFGPS